METSAIPKSIPLKDLALGTTMQHITVRLMRTWEARNFKRNGELMSLDLLFLYAMDCLIQASIHHRRISAFKNDLQTGHVYTITNFEVVQSYERYKVAYNNRSIRFIDTTTLEEVVEENTSIMLEKFRLRTYTEFINLANTNLHLPDVVGHILSVQGYKLEDTSSTTKIVIPLMLREMTVVRLTIWDDQAPEFRKQFGLAGGNNNVIVCTCVNPKIFTGTLYLNTTGASNFYFDRQLQAIKQYKEDMGIEDDSAYPTIEEKNAEATMEAWDIRKLFAYCKTSDAQEKEVICRATVCSISARNEWNYVSCAKCSKKLIRSDMSFLCNTCHETNAIGILKIDLIVNDGEERTKFVIFDRDGRKLTNDTAENINTQKIMEINNINEDSLPMSVRGIIGKTMDFQVKITPFNFKTSSQTFTVSRVIREINSDETHNEMNPMKEFTKTVDGVIVDQALEEHGDEETLEIQCTRKNKRARIGEQSNMEEVTPTNT